MTGRLGTALSWAWASVAFHRARSLVAVLLVAVATALVAFTLGFRSGFERALDRNVEALGYQVLVTGKGCPHEAATLILRGGAIPMYIQEEVYRHVVAQPEVADSTRFLMQSLPGELPGSHQLYVGIDADFLRLKPGVGFQRGEWFSAESADEAILGFNVAEFRRLTVGEPIEVLGRRLTVRGVLDQLGTQDDGTVFLPLAVAQDVFEKPDRLTGIGLRLDDVGSAAGLIDRLYDVPSIQVVRMSEVQSAVLNVLRGMRALLLAFAAVCLTLALLGVFGAALLTLQEQRPELGVLRALGCPGRTLFGLAWCESLVLSTLGAGGGTVLALVLRGAAERFLRASLSFVPGGPVVETTPAVLGASAALVVVLCLVAAVLPAWRGAVAPPATSMRGAG